MPDGCAAAFSAGLTGGINMPLAQILNEQFTLPQYLDFFARILVACLCGGLIGLERSKRNKEAGIRTHIIVCCATALIMIISKYSFADLENSVGLIQYGSRGADPARIAAQVVSGISFLGAGVIFKQHGAVKGLTTAAGLWATAGIGMAIGAGMYILGLFTTATMLLLQVVTHKFSIGLDSLTSSRVGFTVKWEDGFQQAMDNFARENKMQLSEVKIVYLEDGYVSYNMVVYLPQELATNVWDQFLREHAQVREVSCTTV